MLYTTPSRDRKAVFPSSTTKARSDSQPSKASDLISVTDAGTVKVVSAVQMENVKSGIVVMPPSMRTSP